jgi:hypothetical protein
MTWAEGLDSEFHVLRDGRRVTVRHAVPSDAPRLTLLGIDDGLGVGRVALADHGTIVAYAAPARRVFVADGWLHSGLATLLTSSISEEQRRDAASAGGRVGGVP